MDILLLVTLFVIGLASFALELKGSKQLVQIFQSLFLVVCILWMSESFNEEVRGSFYILSGTTVFAYIAAQFLVLNKWLTSLVTLLIGIGFFLLIGSSTMIFNELVFVPEAKFLILAIVLAAAGPLIADLKLDLFSSLIPESESKDWLKSFHLLFVGVATFLGVFSAPGVGVLAVGTVFLIGSFFRKDNTGNVALSLVSIGMISLLTANLEVSPLLLDGDVLEGLFVGAFGIYLYTHVSGSEKSRLPLLLAVFFLPLTLIFGIGYAGSQLELLGGIDAVIAALIGAALVNIIKGENYSGVSIFSMLLGIGILFAQVEEDTSEEVETSSQIVTVKGGLDEKGNEVLPPEVLPLSELKGQYTFDKDSSLVLFRLGKNGATKGKFKKVSGSINVTSDITNSLVNVVLDMNDFTTFSSSRDGHLRNEEYFNVARYPKMTFKADKFIETNENVYNVQGRFTMLGVTKPLKVTMQRVKVGDQLVLIGSGTIDRTQFGMTPSASEGNIVDFDYQVLLQK